MTPPVDDPEVLRRILANTDALLLDFDGPICSVFSGFPAPIVADQLRAILAEGGHTNLPHEVATATDPFDILFYAATLGPEEARYVEAAFRAHEVEAIQTAQPTPGAHNLIHAWKANGRLIAIVSNNSAAAIEVYLEHHCLHDQVDQIAARTGAETTLLKPSSHLVDRVVIDLQLDPRRCTLVGDSIADIRAANAANVSVIGYANRPIKVEQFARIGASALVTTMAGFPIPLP